MLDKIYSISIKTKITLTVFFIIIFFSSGLIWQVSNSQARDVNTLALNTTKDIIKINETFFIKSLLEDDIWSIYKFLDSLTKINLIKSAGFIDTNNHIIAHTNSLTYPIGSVANFTKNDNIVKIELLNDSTYLGYFAIEIEKTSLFLFFDAIQTHFVASIAIAALLSFLIAYLISHRILYRLEIVSHNASMIQQKKWNLIKQIDSKEKDEITMFQNSIELILKQLTDAIEKENFLREFYHSILESLDELILLCDEKFTLLYHNQHKLELTILKNNALDKGLIQEIKTHMEKGHKSLLYSFEDKKGRTIALHIIIKQLKDSIAIAISDISLLKHLEEQQCFTNSFEIVGEISSSVVHEIKNYLQPAKLLLEREDMDNEDRLRVINILSKMDILVNDFLKTGRPIDKLLAKELIVKNEIKNILQILKDQISKKNIIVETNIKEDATIYIATNDLEIILLNLIKNSIEESSEGGKIIITSYHDKEYTIVEVTDFGKGIDKAILKNIHKPFFTTKGENGSGIGLYTTYKIVYMYKGYIDVESQSGKTTMRVFIPKEEK